jgi:S1-C subfamily serine protease
VPRALPGQASVMLGMRLSSVSSFHSYETKKAKSNQPSRALSEKQTAADFEDFSQFVRTYDLWVEKHGTNALSLDVFPNSPAARAGLRRGQEIVQVDGRAIDDAIKECSPKTLRDANSTAERWAFSAAL